MKVENGLMLVDDKQFIIADTIYKVSDEKFIGIRTYGNDTSVIKYIVTPMPSVRVIDADMLFLFAECSMSEVSHADIEALQNGKYKKYFYPVLTNKAGYIIQVRDSYGLLLNEDYDKDLHPFLDIEDYEYDSSF